MEKIKPNRHTAKFRTIKILQLINCLWLLIGPSLSQAKTNITLHIHGLDGQLLKEANTNLQTRLSLVEKITPQAIENFCIETTGELSNLLKFHGYHQGKVINIIPKKVKSGWQIFFLITKGIPVKIKFLDLKIIGEGKNDPLLISKLTKIPLKIGSILKIADYYNAKHFLFDLANKYGYPRATMAIQKIIINSERDAASITLHLNTQKRCYFGTTILNNNFFSQKFLLKFINYHRGELYSNIKLQNLETSMANSAFFQRTEVIPHLNNTYPNIPIEIKVEPKKSRQSNFSIGYGTDTGIRTALELWRGYLTNGYHQFKLTTKLSEPRKNLELHYLIPGNPPTTDMYNLRFSNDSLNFSKGNSVNATLGIDYTTLIKNWQQTFGINFQHEHYTMLDQPRIISNLILTNLHWFRNQKDDLINPRRGYNFDINLIGATKYTLSSSSFMQLLFRAKFIYPLSSNNTAIFNSALGFTAIDDISQLPLSLQFYTGGSQSIRGFSYNSIGPGTNLVFGSFTLRRKIAKDFYLEAFFDLGNVHNNSLAKPNQSIGCGIVWKSIIGSIELTYAKAISKPRSPTMIQFSLGPEL